jgi:acetate kinase
MRILLESSEQTAKEAVDLFCYRIIREIGSLSAAMGGLDAIVFTGGIGEHACAVRAQVISGCAWLGAFLDKAMNDKNGPCISSPESTVSAWVIPTNEEWVIARHTERYIR